MSLFAMQALPRRSIPKRHLAWALVFAWLLPFAQLAATWHEMSHAEFGSASARDSKQAPHLTHCDLCLTAAAVAGGALLAEPPALALAPLRAAAPRSAVAAVWIASPARAYRSRAPPLVSS